MEQRQRETDRQAGLFYRHEMDKARFAEHSVVIHVPRVVSEPVRVSPALLGTKAERDAFADRMLAAERANSAAAIADELKTEGRVHVNTRAQRHE